MAKTIFIITLVLGMFMHPGGVLAEPGAARAELGRGSADTVTDELTLSGHVRIWNGGRFQDDLSGFDVLGRDYPSVHIQQSDPNAPYRTGSEGRFADVVTLLLEGGRKYYRDECGHLTDIVPMSNLLIIRNHGQRNRPEYIYDDEKEKWRQTPGQYIRESELRFDNGACFVDSDDDGNPDTCDSNLDYINAAIYTWGNDRILRLRPFKQDEYGRPAAALNLGKAEMRIKNHDGNLAARIAALSDRSAALEFVGGPDDARFRSDSPGWGVMTTSRIYRPAGSGDLRIAVADESNEIKDRVAVDSNGNVGIGTNRPTQRLEVNGGIRLNTTGSRPVCDSTARGVLWFTGDDLSGDTLEVCAYDGRGYDWRVLF